MKRIYAIGSDGDWYVIPYEMKEEFLEELNELIIDDYQDYDKVNEFEYKYGKYRTGGDLNLIALYAEI